MYYANIKSVDIANGEGCRVSLFCSGCRFHCKDCFNSETWDFKYGQEFTDETMSSILDMTAHSYIQGLSLLGGEPLHPDNIGTIAKIAETFKATYPNKDIWCWTGYTYEGLRANAATNSEYAILLNKLLNNINVLVDGLFVKTKKDIRLKFRGSSNQRIIDIPKTLNNNNQIVLHSIMKTEHLD